MSTSQLLFATFIISFKVKGRHLQVEIFYLKLTYSKMDHVTYLFICFIMHVQYHIHKTENVFAH